MLVSDPDALIEDIAIAVTSQLFTREANGLAIAHASLDAFADGLDTKLAKGVDLRAKVTAFSLHVFGTLGFAGATEHYYDPRNSDLLSVLERRQGIPISMAIVLMALGRRVGLLVQGVGFPGHFLVRVGGADGFLVDPFTRGMLLDEPALERLLRKQFGPRATLRPEHFALVDHSAIAQRLLANLYAIYNGRREHALAMVVADRLFSLTDRVEHQRDRAIHALALGASVGATLDLKAYLAARPDAGDAPQVRALLAGPRSKDFRAN
jgi:regulator of sirC expression with transglutaminase-like and TPR domain